MILLLGGRGYVGQAIAQQLAQQSLDYRVISRAESNYADKDCLTELIRESGAKFLINAAGYTGKPNVDACEIYKTDCLFGNGVLPGVIRDACEATDLPWGHVSSGCIFTGRRSDGAGFQETDAPNFCFRTNNCSFYSGTKALGEEVLAGAENVYIWRLRIPFNHVDGPRNYLSKVIRYAKLLEAENSISHLGDFARCCVESWTKRIPFGTYNVTNTGSVTTREVADMVKKELKLDRSFEFFKDESEFMNVAAKTPRSNCVMDNAKLRATGIEMPDVRDAIVGSLQQWNSSTLLPENA